MNKKEDKPYHIVKDNEGRNIVILDSIIFTGKRQIKWRDVEEYLKNYVGRIVSIAASDDVVYIGKDFPDEYAGSRDTIRLKGGLAKAKANASQGLVQIVENAVNKRYKENLSEKHNIDAKMGWYRYTSRFGLPIYQNGQQTEDYNIYRIEVLVRRDETGKMYLYDLVNIKKETSNPLES